MSTHCCTRLYCHGVLSKTRCGNTAQAADRTDLAPSDLFLFLRIKKGFKGHHFVALGAVIEVTMRCLKEIPAFQGSCGLQNVTIDFLPRAVERGGQATLLCLYDLEGAPLYTVKWYRGQREFYRYSPNETPSTKIFPFHGIHVDLSMSNATQVVVQKVGFNLSGNLSCEVTTDAPSFKTAVVSRELMVIELPQRGPKIDTEKDRYDVGDVLKANCTSAPSRPPSTLSFFLNENPVGVPGVRVHDVGDGLTVSQLGLEVRLEPMHLTGVQVVLKCTTLVSTLFRKTTVVTMGPRTTEPVPEKVTSPSSSTHTGSSYLLLLLLILLSSR